MQRAENMEAEKKAEEAERKKISAQHWHLNFEDGNDARERRINNGPQYIASLGEFKAITQQRPNKKKQQQQQQDEAGTSGRKKFGVQDKDIDVWGLGGLG